MARSHARVFTSIWSNDDFRTLTSSQQRLFLTLLSQPELSLCGVLDYSPKRLARLAADTTPKRVSADADALQARNYVVIDDDTDELAIRTFMRHDGVLAMPNPLKAAARAFQAIHSTRIRAVIVEGLPLGIRQAWPERLLRMDTKDLAVLLKDPAYEQRLPEPDTEPHPEPFPNPSGNTLVPVVGRLSSVVGHPTNPTPEAERFTSTGTPSVTPPDRGAAAPDDDDDDLDKLWPLLADRRIELEHPDGAGVRVPARYRPSVIADHRNRHEAAARRLRAEHPTWPLTRIADTLEPDTAPRHPEQPTVEDSQTILDRIDTIEAERPTPEQHAAAVIDTIAELAARRRTAR